MVLAGEHLIGKVPQSVVGNGRILFRTQDQAYGWVLVRVGPVLASIVKIEIHLTSIGVGKLSKLQVFCGARRYVASEPWTADFRPSRVSGRHIIQSEAAQKGEECDVVPPVLLRNGRTNLAGRQSFGLHLEIDFRVDIRGVQ